jgi:hypothetical protein
MLQVLELVDKDFTILVINMLKKRDKLDTVNEEMENFDRGVLSIMKLNYRHRNVNWILEIKYIVDRRLDLSEERSNELKGSSVESFHNVPLVQ